MATNEELQELARKAWPGRILAVSADYESGKAWASVWTSSLASAMNHPRAREALEAALRVLAGEQLVPVSRLRELVAKWRADEGACDTEQAWRCAEDLEGLIDDALAKND